MKGFLRFIGRLLFITILLTSAAMKIKQPTSFNTSVTNGYTTIRSLHPILAQYFPSANDINAKIPIGTLIRGIGATQGLIALLILFGDSLGGFLYFVFLTVTAVATYAPTIMQVIAKQKFNELLPLLPNLSLFAVMLGLSFVFLASRPKKTA